MKDKTKQDWKGFERNFDCSLLVTVQRCWIGCHTTSGDLQKLTVIMSVDATELDSTHYYRQYQVIFQRQLLTYCGVPVLMKMKIVSC